MRFQLPDICVEQFSKACQEARASADHRIVIPVVKENGLDHLDTLNGKKIKSVNLACYHCEELKRPHDARLAWFEIETED